MGKKNAQLHLVIEENLCARLLKESEEEDVSLSEICRRKLNSKYSLQMIKNDLDEIKRLIKNG